jgi:AcrR family transcriptional regulator
MAAIDVRDSTAEDRILDAALRCIARWGASKTTLDDVARDAGCSRATVYRLFPGGKDNLLEALLVSEMGRFFERLTEAVAGIDDLEDLLVTGIVTAGRALLDHEALQFLLAHEPEVVLPRIAFRNLDAVLGVVSQFAAPFLAPHVGADEALRAAEWLARIVLSYTMVPSQWGDVSDEASIRRLVRTFVLPGLREPVHQ